MLISRRRNEESVANAHAAGLPRAARGGRNRRAGTSGCFDSLRGSRQPDQGRSSSGSTSTSAGRAEEASHTEDQHRQVQEGVERGSRAIDPVAQPTEALEPAKRALNDVALPRERGVLGIQFARGLLSRDAAPRRNERPEPALLDKLAEPAAVIASVSEQRWLAGFGEIRQDATQDRRRCVNVGEGEKPKRRRESCPGLR